VKKIIAKIVTLPLIAVVFVGEVLLAGIEVFVELIAAWAQDKEDA
jgi:hypothetical protein